MGMTVGALKDVLEQGPYAWPGGYPVFFIAADGEALSFQAVQDNLALVKEATDNPGSDPQWEVVGYDVNWEDENMYCAHTNKKIECAYPNEESKED